MSIVPFDRNFSTPPQQSRCTMAWLWCDSITIVITVIVVFSEAHTRQSEGPVLDGPPVLLYLAASLTAFDCRAILCSMFGCTMIPIVMLILFLTSSLKRVVVSVSLSNRLSVILVVGSVRHPPFLPAPA